MPKAEKRSTQTIVAPVQDDGRAPYFRCGEFAVVDTTVTEPQNDAFVLVRLSNNDLKLARLRRWTQRQVETIVPPREKRYWSIVYGKTPIFGFGPADRWLKQTGSWQMSDGPAGDKLLRTMIIGRVVGVLGADDGASNWKGTAK